MANLTHGRLFIIAGCGEKRKSSDSPLAECDEPFSKAAATEARDDAAALPQGSLIGVSEEFASQATVPLLGGCPDAIIAISDTLRCAIFRDLAYSTPSVMHCAAKLHKLTVNL